ncbi:MAG: hypothetical protein RSA75_05055 [Bacteroidales bacterium]
MFHIPRIREIGFVEKELIISDAKVNIFANEYFESTAVRKLITSSDVVDL